MMIWAAKIGRISNEMLIAKKKGTPKGSFVILGIPV